MTAHRLVLAALLAERLRLRVRPGGRTPRSRRRSTSPAARPIRRRSSACSSSSTRPGSSRPSGSSKADVDALLAKPDSVLFIDLRTPGEHIQYGSFPVFLSVQNKDLEKQLAWLPRDRQIVTVSNHSQRAGAAADLLAAKGFNVAGATGCRGIRGGRRHGGHAPGAARRRAWPPRPRRRRVPEPAERRHDHARARCPTSAPSTHPGRPIARPRRHAPHRAVGLAAARLPLVAGGRGERGDRHRRAGRRVDGRGTAAPGWPSSDCWRSASRGASWARRRRASRNSRRRPAASSPTCAGAGAASATTRSARCRCSRCWACCRCRPPPACSATTTSPSPVRSTTWSTTPRDRARHGLAPACWPTACSCCWGCTSRRSRSTWSSSAIA